MSWWFTHSFDKKRLRRELSQLSQQDPTLHQLWYALYEPARLSDHEDLEMARLMLADRAEEHGRPVLAKMIREWTSCVPPKYRQKKRKGVR